MKLRLLPIALLRWLADVGLSLSAADYVLPEAREGAVCPFAQLLRPEHKKKLL